MTLHLNVILQQLYLFIKNKHNCCHLYALTFKFKCGSCNVFNWLSFIKHSCLKFISKKTRSRCEILYTFELTHLYKNSLKTDVNFVLTLVSSLAIKKIFTFTSVCVRRQQKNIKNRKRETFIKHSHLFILNVLVETTVELTTIKYCFVGNYPRIFSFKLKIKLMNVET